MLSINTNTGQMAALRVLAGALQTSRQIEQRVSSGLRVGSPKDDGAAFAIAQNERAMVASYDALGQSRDRAISLLDVTQNGLQNISDLLIQMRKLAAEASDPSLDAQSRAALNDDFLALKQQIDSTSESSSFMGNNLLASSSSKFITYGGGINQPTVDPVTWNGIDTGEPQPGDTLTLRFGFDLLGSAQPENVTGTIDFRLRYRTDTGWVDYGRLTPVVNVPNTTVINPGGRTFTATVAMPVLPPTASTVQIYAEFAGQVPYPDGPVIDEEKCYGAPADTDNATGVPHLLAEWNLRDWSDSGAGTQSYGSGFTVDLSGGVPAGQSTEPGTAVNGSFKLTNPDPGITQAGFDYSVDYQVMDRTTGNWVTLANSGTQTVAAGAVNPTTNLAYSMTIPQSGSERGFLQSRLKANITVHHNTAAAPGTLEDHSFSQVFAVSPSSTYDGSSVRTVETSDRLDTLNGINGASTPLRNANMSTAGVNGLRLSAVDLSSADAAAHALQDIDAAQQRVQKSLVYYADKAQALTTLHNAETQFANATKSAIGRLADADLSSEAARLYAIKTKQQLAVQSLSIANDAPKLLLQLFH